MVNEAPQTYKLGPGELQIGAVGSEIDFTAQLTGCTVSWDKDKEDDVPVLSGGVLAGDTVYTAKISGNLFQDLGAEDSVLEWTWTHKGEALPFAFTPSSAAGKTVSGVVVVDPIDVGGDEVKKRPRSDFEWSCVGEPTLGDAVVGLMGLVDESAVVDESADRVDEPAPADDLA